MGDNSILRSAAIGLVFLFGAASPLPSHGQWVEAPGTGWIQIQIAHQQTQEGFSEEGNVIPLDELDPDARSIITTARLTGSLVSFAGSTPGWTCPSTARNSMAQGRIC